jgi:signal peptidase I
MFFTYLWRTFKIVFVMIFVIMFIRTFLIEPGKVNGKSMEPNFYDQEVFLVSKFSLLFAEPERSDLVQVYDESTGELVLKRIIGLPGEQISIKQNHLYIISETGEETLLEEDYLAKGTLTRSKAQGAETYELLEEHMYFVVGDNRMFSVDSRYYGGVHRTQIQGLVLKIPRF